MPSNTHEHMFVYKYKYSDISQWFQSIKIIWNKVYIPKILHLKNFKKFDLFK